MGKISKPDDEKALRRQGEAHPETQAAPQGYGALRGPGLHGTGGEAA